VVLLLAFTLLELHAAEDLLKARFGPQEIVLRLPEIRQVRISRLVAPLEPLQGVLLVTGKNVKLSPAFLAEPGIGTVIGVTSRAFHDLLSLLLMELEYEFAQKESNPVTGRTGDSVT
jgi:hypothetical protein